MFANISQLKELWVKYLVIMLSQLVGSMAGMVITIISVKTTHDGTVKTISPRVPVLYPLINSANGKSPTDPTYIQMVLKFELMLSIFWVLSWLIIRNF